MATTYTHRIWCTTEGAWVAKETDSRTRLTQCPTNAAHAVDLGSAELISERPAIVVDKEVAIATGGYVRCDSVILDAPAAGSATAVKTWPVDIAMYSIRVAVPPAAVGCNLTVEGSPLTAVGTLTADAPIGTAVLSVTPTAAAAAAKGLVLTLQMGATVQECGRITALDKTLNTITVETATTSNFLAAGPTVVRLTARAAESLELAVEGMLGFGESRAQAIAFPVGRSISARLTNPTAAPARAVLYLSYNY